MKQKNKFILWFNQISIKDVPLVGGKNASLGEMYRKLTKKGVMIPNGFAITAAAYRHFLKESGVGKEIRKILQGAKFNQVKELQQVGQAVRQAILQAELPDDLIEDIKTAYQRLTQEYHCQDLDVAVRSSATAEDLPSASFAGQQETFLNVRGEDALLSAVKKCFASLFTDRAISYRAQRGFNYSKVALSVGVQKMVRSDKAVSGVMFTLDTESGFRKVVLINAIYGLGENIVQGLVNPDEYYVFKPTLRQYLDGNKKINPIISQQVGSKKKEVNLQR